MRWNAWTSDKKLGVGLIIFGIATFITMLVMVGGYSAGGMLETFLIVISILPIPAGAAMLFPAADSDDDGQ